ncbi:AAA family ATPase [Streptomyces sp. NPDC001178]
MSEPTKPPARAVTSFLPGPPIDRTRVYGWHRWVRTRELFVPAPILSTEQYLQLTPRRRRIHDLHRLATHSSLPVQSTPMGDAVAWLVKARIEDGAYSHKAGIRTGVMVNGGGAQGKTETVCAAIAAFEEEWLEVNEYMNPEAMAGTRDLLAPVAYVRCPVKATPVSTCQRILDFYGEDCKNMRQEDLIRTVNAAIAAHATKALVIDDITRLKLHRESDQDVLDLLLEVMSMSVTLILVGVGIPTSGLLRRGSFDPVAKQWVIPPVKDRGRSPNPDAATQLADLVDEYATPYLHNPSQRGLQIRRSAPRGTAETSALLLAAATALGDRVLVPLRERIEPLAREAYRRSASIGDKLFKDSNVSAILLRATAQRVYGFQKRSILRVAPDFYRFSTAEIPPLLPREWFDAYFQPLVHRLPKMTTLLERHLRWAASLRLAELVCDQT